jgi:hypothetical protein
MKFMRGLGGEINSAGSPAGLVICTICGTYISASDPHFCTGSPLTTGSIGSTRTHEQRIADMERQIAELKRIVGG